MSISKVGKDENIFQRALKEYIRLLQLRPVLTKAVTSACISGLGTTISQLIVPDPRAKGRIYWRSVFAYMSFGFVVSGPTIHHLYAFMEKYMPKEKKTSAIQRVIFDRLIFTPPFLAIFLYSVFRLEGLGQEASIQRLKTVYWTILKLNWLVWTVLQYIIVKYVPLKFRPVVGNLFGLVYAVIVSVLRRRAAAS